MDIEKNNILNLFKNQSQWKFKVNIFNTVIWNNDFIEWSCEEIKRSLHDYKDIPNLILKEISKPRIANKLEEDVRGYFYLKVYIAHPTYKPFCTEVKIYTSSYFDIMYQKRTDVKFDCYKDYLDYMWNRILMIFYYHFKEKKIIN